MAQKKETTEASVSSQAAGVKGKGSANALAAKLKTRRLRTAVGAVVFVGMAAGLRRRREHGHDVRLRLGHVLDAVPFGRAGHHDRHEDHDSRARWCRSCLLPPSCSCSVARSARGCARPCSSIASATSSARPRNAASSTEKKNSEIKAISQQELASLKAAKDGYACGACGKCQPVHHGKVDSRHAVLGGAAFHGRVRVPGVLPRVSGGPHVCHGARHLARLRPRRRDHRAHSHSGHARHRTGGAAEMVLQLLPAFGPHEPGRALLAHVCAYH